MVAPMSSAENTSGQGPAVLYERRGHKGYLTLNRPDNRNSMTPEVLDAFDGAIRAAAEDREIRVLVIRGTGSCFSAGADFKSNIQRDEGPVAQAHERSYAMYIPFLRVLDVPVPVVGALNGHAVGGGFGLALMCDLRVASATAKYGANFAKVGLHSGMSISYVLPRLVGLPKASEMLYTGELIRGEEAARIGLVNSAVEADAVLARAEQYADQIASCAPYAVQQMKRSIRRGLDWQVKEAAYDEAFAQATSLTMEDAGEGMKALLEKRAPVFKGR